MIGIRISAISGIQIYSDIYLVNMLHPNIFGYSFGTLCGIRICLDIRLCPFYYIRSSLAWHVFDRPGVARAIQQTASSLIY